MKIGIIGGGPAGYLAALKAGLLGHEVLLFEKEKVGGVCLNRGCIPVKAFIKVAYTFGSLKKMGGMGIDVEVKGFNWERGREVAELASRRLVAGVNNLLKKRQVILINKTAELLEPGLIKSDEKEYKVDAVLLATGSVPKSPPFPCSEGVWNSDDALKSHEIPEKIGIIGAGVIGLEFAYIFRSLGSAVTIFEIMDEVLPGEDREMAGTLRKEMEKLGIKFKLGVKVEGVEKSGDEYRVVFVDGDKEEGIEFSKVMVSIGRELSREGIPDSLLLDNGFVKVDSKMETSMKGVYAAGDCTGGLLLAHTAYHEAEVAIDNILGKDTSVDESVVPRVVYTKPELGACGLTEDKLKREGIDYTREYFPFTSNGRAIAENETRGGVKLLFDRNGNLLGGSILGGVASEMIHILAISMKNGLKADEIFHTIFGHPTYSEAIKEAASSFLGFPIHG